MSDSNKVDYKNTVFLPKTDFPMRGSLAVKEPELLARWKQIDIYGKLRAQAKSAKKEKFVLHDGPPYANGNIHIGHSLNKILKDVVVRSYQMLGYDAPYVPGWDCHGLPIEWKIEEQYRAKNQDKDAIPKLQFRAECRAFAEHWKGVQSEEFQRLGVLGDWKHPYSTMTHAAEAQIVKEIHKFLMNGLLYKGERPVMWSVVEKTALAEAEVEYHDHKSTTIWVKFPVVKSSNKLLGDSVSVVIWTTTPWTIPGNRAIAYGKFDYVLVKVEEVADGAVVKPGDKLVVAAELVKQFCEDVKVARLTEVAKLSHDDLEHTVCAHPMRGGAAYGGYFDYDVPLHFGDFVTTEAGTGFVHIAPGHGEDDFNLGRKYNVKFEPTVGDDGVYLPSLTGLAGKCVYKPDGSQGDANGAVMKGLNEVGAMIAKKNIVHSYPHSWRSKAPLIFRTTPQWFIALDEKPEGGKKTLREMSLDAISATEWYPAIGENRIRGMLESRPDWCVSRQREWGVPIAIFVDKKTGKPLRDQEVLDRVSDAFAKEGADAWYSRKAQDFLGSKYKAEDYDQVFDIIDVWFESGATHAFCLNQDLGQEWPELSWPADLYLEGSDQHRGWFHSSLLESCGTTGRAPYKKVLTHGFTLDEKGLKMSKSLGNTVVPQEIYEKMGADILRLWVFASDYSQDLRIGPEIIKQMGDLYRRFRNTLRYMLGALDGMGEKERVKVSEMPELEKWVLHRLYEMDKVVREDCKKFDYSNMLMELHNFCTTDLSAFYFDIRKDSLYCDRPDSIRRRSARTVMEILFDHITTWLAPLICFTAEEAYLARHPGTDGSVHLLEYPKVPSDWKNEALSKKWEQIRDIRRVVTGAMELARNDKKIGSSLGAKPQVYISAEQAKCLEGLDFAEISISSGIAIHQKPAPEGAFTLNDVAGVGVVINLAEGKKCERCWQILPEVGRDHPDLCRRCEDAVKNSKAGAA